MKSTQKLKGKVNTKKTIVISLLVLFVLAALTLVEAQELTITRVTGAGAFSDPETQLEYRFAGAAMRTQDGYAKGMWSQAVTGDGMSQIMCQVSNLRVNEAKNEVVIYGHVLQGPAAGARCNVWFTFDQDWQTVVEYHFAHIEWNGQPALSVGGFVTEDHLRFTW